MKAKEISMIVRKKVDSAVPLAESLSQREVNRFLIQTDGLARVA